MTFRVKFYRDQRGEFRWSKIAGNNRVIDASSEGYVDPRGARDNLLLTMPGYAKVDGGLLNEHLAEDDPARFVPVEVLR